MHTKLLNLVIICNIMFYIAEESFIPWTAILKAKEK